MYLCGDADHSCNKRDSLHNLSLQGPQHHATNLTPYPSLAHTNGEILSFSTWLAWLFTNIDVIRLNYIFWHIKDWLMLF